MFTTDPPPRVDHVRDRVARAGEDAPEIRVEHAVVLLAGRSSATDLSRPTPALLQSTSTRPKRATASPTRRSASCSSRTSAATNTTFAALAPRAPARAPRPRPPRAARRPRRRPRRRDAHDRPADAAAGARHDRDLALEPSERSDCPLVISDDMLVIDLTFNAGGDRRHRSTGHVARGLSRRSARRSPRRTPSTSRRSGASCGSRSTAAPTASSPSGSPARC